MSSTVTISEELLDLMVNAMTRLPYGDAAPIFSQLAEEMEKSREPQTPQIIAGR